MSDDGSTDKREHEGEDEGDGRNVRAKTEDEEAAEEASEEEADAVEPSSREIGDLIVLKSFNDCMKHNCLSQLKKVAAAAGVDFTDVPLDAGVEHCTIGELKVFRFMSGDTQVGGGSQGKTCGKCCEPMGRLDDDMITEHGDAEAGCDGCGAKGKVSELADADFARCFNDACDYGLCSKCTSAVQISCDDGEFNADGAGQSAYKGAAAQLQAALAEAEEE